MGEEADLFPCQIAVYGLDPVRVNQGQGMGDAQPAVKRMESGKQTILI